MKIYIKEDRGGCLSIVFACSFRSLIGGASVLRWIECYTWLLLVVSNDLRLKVTSSSIGLILNRAKVVVIVVGSRRGKALICIVIVL
jgi:hypothetical protein